MPGGQEEKKSGTKAIPKQEVRVVGVTKRPNMTKG